MANLNDLKNAIKEILEENGSLNKIRAEIRENIYKAIETDESPKPKIPEENLIINELFREYLNYNGYYHSNSVFLSESGHPNEPPLDRNFIAKELNVIEDKHSKGIPLIYSILFGLKKEVYDPVEDIEKDEILENKGNYQIKEVYTKDQPKGIIYHNN